MFTFFKKEIIPLILCLLLLNYTSQAQDDNLFEELDAITEEESTDVIATFKSTRLMLAQSTERVRNGQLHFRISHVFSRIEGISNFFGIDNLNNMHLGLEYGITDYLQVGIARSNKPDKTYSGAIKASILRQKSGKKSFPFALTYYGNIDYKSRQYTPIERDENTIGRLDYINQILVSSKITDHLSMQLSPTWVHLNLRDAVEQPNDVYSLGVGGRYLISRSTSINVEYFYTIPTFDAEDINKNTLTIGFDIETGGHVFQLYFTNAFALHPGKFAINESGDFFNREINFGFSILRAFSLK